MNRIALLLFVFFAWASSAHAQSGTLSFSPSTCTISSEGQCSTTVTWTSSGTTTATLWVESGPINVGSWVHHAPGATLLIPWIRQGTTVFVLRAGAPNQPNGKVLARRSVTGLPGSSGAATGQISASPSTCTIPQGSDTCNSSLSWSTQGAASATLWVLSGPTNAGLWIHTAVADTIPIYWIHEGTYTFVLRAGSPAEPNAPELARTSITGIRQVQTSASLWSTPANCTIPSGQTHCSVYLNWQTSGYPEVTLWGVSGPTRAGTWIHYAQNDSIPIYDIAAGTYVFALRAGSPAQPNAPEIARVTLQGIPQQTATGTLTANPTSCVIPVGAQHCTTQLTWSAQGVSDATVWILSGPTLQGQWIDHNLSNSLTFGQIAEGTYVIALRGGPPSNPSAAELARVTVTGTRAVPSPKFTAYFRGKTLNPSFPGDMELNLDYSNEVLEHTNTLYVQLERPDLHLAGILDSLPPGKKLLLDTTNFLFGCRTWPCNTCGEGNTISEPGLHFDVLDNAQQKWTSLMAQLTAQQYAKILAVLPVDEPDLHQCITAADMSSFETMVRKFRPAGASSSTKIGGVLSPRIAGNGPLGTQTLVQNPLMYDLLAVNCYPINYSSPSLSACNGFTDQQFFAKLEQISKPSARFFVVAEGWIGGNDVNPAPKLATMRNRLSYYQSLTQTQPRVDGLLMFLYSDLCFGNYGPSCTSPVGLRGNISPTESPLLRARARDVLLCLGTGTMCY